MTLLKTLLSLSLFYSIQNFAESPLGRITCGNSLFSLESSVQRQKELNYSDQELNTWFKVRNPKAIALVVHGFNMRSYEMKDVIRLLNENQIDVLRITLDGHGGPRELIESSSVTRKKWLLNAFEGYCITKAESEEYNLPLYYVGYSLGGLVGNDLINAHEEENFNFTKMILFAPAVAMSTVKVTLAKLKDFNILGAMDSILAGLKFVKNSSMSKSQISTIVFHDVRDKVVGYKKLDEFIKNKNLHYWTHVNINADKKKMTGGFHRIVHKENVGELRWKAIDKKLKEFLGY